MNQLSKATLLVAVLSAPSVLMAAPSKEETYNFLKDKLSFTKSEPGTKAIYSTAQSNDYCTLSHESKVYLYKYTQDVAYTMTKTIDLSTLNPDKVSDSTRAGQPTVELETRDKKELISMEFINNPAYNNRGTQLVMSERSNFYVKNREDAEKSVRAFKHLALLCGAKQDLF